MADVNANIGVNIDTSNALAQLKALQRQISQFHSSIAKSSETAGLAQRDLQRNFINGVNAIGSFSAELRTVKTTAESFTDALEKNKFSMREYFRYAGASTKTFGKLFRSEFDTVNKVAEENVKRLQTQYIKMGRDANGAMRAIAIMPNELDMSKMSTQLQITAQRQALFNQLVKQGSTNLLNFGKNTQWAGRQLMVGFTLPLATLGLTASRTFMEMETAALKFRKVYGDLFTPKEETQQALADVTALGQMFTKYGIAVSQTVGLAAEAAAAGFQGIDLQRQTTEATRLSVLGQIEQQKALETTISLQNAFKMSSEDLAGSIDFLNAVENQTVVSLDDITTAIPKVAPVIQQLGGDVKDLAFFMAAMKEGGVNASEGANALKSGLAALINPTEKASQILADMGINIKAIVETNKGDLKGTVIAFAQALDTLDPLTRARAIEQLFGKFQFARLSTLFDNVTNQTGQAARVLDLAGTSVEDLAALSEQELGMTADSAMNKFRKSVEDLKVALIPVGQTFLQAVTPIVEFIGGILEKFNNLSSGVKKAIVVLTVAIGAIGPVALMTFGLLANGLANIVKGALVLRQGYLRLTGQTQVLGEQTDFLTVEQQRAAAVAHSLDQSHARLTQTFNAEAGAIRNLANEYRSALGALQQFAARNPGMMMPPKKYNKGVQIVPGSGNKDTVPAMLTPGESVIPADMTKKYGALIQGMIAGNIPGFQKGRLGTARAHLTTPFAPGSAQFTQGIQMAGLEELASKYPQFIKVVSNLIAELPQSLNILLEHGTASIQEFSTKWSTATGKMLSSVKSGGGDINDPEIMAATDQVEQEIHDRTIALAQGTEEQTVSDELLSQATREVIDKYKGMSTALGKVTTALDSAAQQVGQVRIQPRSTELGVRNTDYIRAGLASGEFTQQGGNIFAGGVQIARESQSTPGKLRPASSFNPAGSYTRQPFRSQATQTVDSLINETARAAGTQSPSRRTIPIGEDIARGLEVGMQNRADDVARVGQNVAAGATRAMSRGARTGGPVTPGTDFPVEKTRGGIPLSQVANAAIISNATKQSAEDIVKSAKSFQDRITSLNRSVMGGTFALGSLSGIASMSGGKLGEFAGTLSKLNLAMFALMSVTQLLTQTQFMKLAADRSSLALGAVKMARGGGGIAAMPGLLGKTGFIGAIARAGLFVTKFLGPIGIATTLLGGMAFAIRLNNTRLENQRKDLEAFSDVLAKTTKQTDFLADYFNIVVQKGSLETFGQELERLSVVQRAERQKIKESEGFQEAFGGTIGAVSRLSDEQAKSALTLKGLELISQGMAKEKVQELISAIKEEAGKTNVKLDFASLKFDAAGINQLNSEVGNALKGFQTTYIAGLEKTFKYVTEGEGRSAQIKLVQTLVPTREAKAALKNAGTAVASYIGSVNRLADSGALNLKQYNAMFDGLFENIKKSVPDSRTQMALFRQAVKLIDPDLAKVVKGVNNFSDAQLILKGATVGVSEALLVNYAIALRTADGLNKVAEANRAAGKAADESAEAAYRRATANAAAAGYEAEIKKAIEDALRLAKELNKVTTTNAGNKKAFLEDEIAAIKNQTQAFKQMRLAGIGAAVAAELASNPETAKAIVDLAKKGGQAWKDATAQIKEYRNQQKILEKTLLAGASAGDYELGRLQMAQKFVELQQNLIELQSAPTVKKYNQELELQELILKNINNRIKSISDAEVLPRETLIKQNNYKLEELSLVEDEINTAYNDQIKYLNTVADLNKKINSLQESRLSIADALSRGDISEAAQAAQRARQEEADSRATTAQDQLTNAKELRVAALGRNELEKQNKVLQLQISQIQKNQLDAMQLAATNVQDTIDKLNDQLSIEDQIVKKRKESITYLGMTIEQIDSAVKLLESAKDAGINIDVKENLTAFINAAKGNTASLETILNTTVPTAAKEAFDELMKLRDAMDLSATITVATSADGAVASVESVTAAINALNDAASKAATALIMQAKITIDQITFDDFNTKISEVHAKIKAMLKDAADILKDGIITDDELKAFAEKWGLALDQAKKFLTDVDTMFKAAVIDKSAIETFAKAWGIPYDAAVKYLTDANAYLLAGTIDDTKIKDFATKWGLPYDAVKQYLTDSNKYLSETDIDSTSITEYAAKWAEPKDAFNSYTTAVTTGITALSTLDYAGPGNSAAASWNNATSAAIAYTTAAAAAAAAQRDLAAAITATAAAAAAAKSTSTGTGSSENQNVYTVKPGDTLSAIAAANGVTVGDLLEANPKFEDNPKYDDGNKIWSGTTVVIPKKKNRGGLINGPTYMRVGGLTMGSDIVPTTLTPGEFVIRRPAVQGFGVDNLEKINSGEYNNGSVYNYSINVNVKSGSNPDDIARAVMTQIKQVDSQRIRGQRVS